MALVEAVGEKNEARVISAEEGGGSRSSRVSGTIRGGRMALSHSSRGLLLSTKVRERDGS
jgi:hypothetical protein